MKFLVFTYVLIFSSVIYAETITVQAKNIRVLDDESTSEIELEVHVSIRSKKTIIPAHNRSRGIGWMHVPYSRGSDNIPEAPAVYDTFEGGTISISVTGREAQEIMSREELIKFDFDRTAILNDVANSLSDYSSDDLEVVLHFFMFETDGAFIDRSTGGRLFMAYTSYILPSAPVLDEELKVKFENPPGLYFGKDTYTDVLISYN